MVIHIYLVLIPLVLFMAALFAAAEAALFSLSETQLTSLRESKPRTYRAIHALIRKPDELLSTVVVGNEALSVLVGTFVVSLLEFYFENWSETVTTLTAILASTFLLLFFSEILPKVLAFRVPVLAASLLVYPATWLHFLLTPLRKLLQAIAKKIIQVFRLSVSQPHALTEKEFLTLVEVGAETGSLERQETEMIYNVFHLNDLTVSNVMTPWKTVFHLAAELGLSDILEKVRTQTFSRIPVVSGKNGHLVGILYTKELLKLLLDTPKDMQEGVLSSAIFSPYYVSTHKKVSRLFREFRTKKVHMAVVVDEYGHHLGVVTLEDILNAIFKTQLKPSESQS
ncbi:MAG: hemolysin family protein [Pseudomonadota bacterium]